MPGKICSDSITIATGANWPPFHSFTNYENENLSKNCQTFCLLEQNVQQAFQTCRFRNLGVDLSQIPSEISLPLSELVPIKNTLKSLYQCPAKPLFHRTGTTRDL